MSYRDREGSYDRDRSSRRSTRNRDQDASPRDYKEKSFSRSPSRGRERSRDHRRDDRDRRERSLSRSRSDRRKSRYSHSPMYSRRRHTGSREDPQPSRCLGVFGLSIFTTEDELFHIFNKFGPVERVQVVIDAKTARSRGFAFVYFKSSDDAKVAKEKCSGMKINQKSIRVDFSITERAHTPTPGIYMGKPTHKFDSRGRRGDRDRDRDDYHRSSRHRRSPSPYYSSSSRSRKRYSRSRSYSPRRY